MTTKYWSGRRKWKLSNVRVAQVKLRTAAFRPLSAMPTRRVPTRRVAARRVTARAPRVVKVQLCTQPVQVSCGSQTFYSEAVLDINATTIIYSAWSSVLIPLDQETVYSIVTI